MKYNEEDRYYIAGVVMVVGYLATMAVMISGSIAYVQVSLL